MDISKIRPPTGIVQPAVLHNPASAYRDGFPIALTASITLDANQQDKPNIQALKNTTPFPISIDEIRFTLSRDDSANDGVIVAGCVGAKLALSCADGSEIDLCQDFVPVWLFDQSRRLYYGESFVGEDGYSVASYVWRLPTPIYLQPGEIIIPELINYGLVPVAIDIGVTYCGRVMVGHPTPQHRTLPFVSMWQSKGFDMSFITAAYPQAATDEDESPENQLYNPSSEPLLLKMFTGRILNGIVGNNNSAFSDDVQPFIDMFCSVNMRTSKGYEITPGQDYVPFHLMFAADTRAFPGGIVLDPGDYVMAKIQMAQGNIVPYDNGGTNIYPTILTPTTVQIGMVGERSVAL